MKNYCRIENKSQNCDKCRTVKNFHRIEKKFQNYDIKFRTVKNNCRVEKKCQNCDNSIFFFWIPWRK